ncbi:MAG TPA: EAL domain-containing protein [Bauldia sp.]|nr:EAL domain-containing protein [Bauldia sp.]
MTGIWTRRGRILLGVLGLVLACAPLVSAHLLIDYNTRVQAERDLSELAKVTIGRAELALDDGLRTLTDLSLLGVSKCEERAFDLMRRAVYAHFRVKEVGILGQKGQMICNHMGDAVSFSALSSSYTTRNRNVSLELVDLGESDRVGVMLTWTYGPEGGLATVVPSEVVVPDLLPRMLHAAQGTMTMLDGAVVGRVPAETAPAPPPSGELVAAVERSARYPISMRIAAPLSIFAAQNRNILVYVNVGGALLGILILALLLYVLRGPPSEIAELRRGVERHEFIPYYQPIIEIASGRLVGCEVLMRWRKPDGTVIPPSGFILHAEATGLIKPMTIDLMEQTRRDLEDTFGRHKDLKISFNLFHTHFVSLRTVRDVEALFGHSKISFQQLIFEITERQPLASVQRAQAIIRRIQALGARVALDDAGTGHAGLAYLQQLGVNIVKIDKLFIDSIGQPGSASPIVDSLIRLGHDLGMEVIAEGVETFDQLDYLRNAGADQAQGFLFSQPLPATAFIDLVEAMEPGAKVLAAIPRPARIRPAAKVA